MKKTILLFIAVLFVFSAQAFAQAKKFRWGENCTYEGTYDSKKYTAVQIQNTEKLMGNYFGLDFSKATVWKYAEIEALNFPPVETEYQKKSAELKSLKIVASPYWEARRRQKLKEMEQYYWLIKTTMASYKTPASLRTYPYAEACKAKYAESLITGGDSLLTVWEKVNIASRKGNSDPALIKAIYDEQSKSPDALKYAVVEVTAFGWWNCANAEINQGDDYSALDKNFRKLFTKVRTLRCAEP